jgi:hypothetical protein
MQPTDANSIDKSWKKILTALVLNLGKKLME